jgi:hypothetical protein
MQAVFGAVVGVLVEYYFLGDVGLFNTCGWLLPTAGSALLGAGLGSLLGDRLWIGDNYHLLPPEEPQHSPLSRILSQWLIAGGVATLVVATIRCLRE